MIYEAEEMVQAIHDALSETMYDPDDRKLDKLLADAIEPLLTEIVADKVAEIERLKDKLSWTKRQQRDERATATRLQNKATADAFTLKSRNAALHEAAKIHRDSFKCIEVARTADEIAWAVTFNSYGLRLVNDSLDALGDV